MQLSDNYVMPTEEEIEKFYETEEYKAWDNENYDSNDKAAEQAYFDKYSKISSDYYKKLGYTTKNSPNYTMTNEEKQKLYGQYIKERRRNKYSNKCIIPRV